MPKVYSIRSRKPRSNDPLHSAHCLAACPITSDTETKLLAGSAPMSICFDRKLTTWARLRGVSLRDEGLNRVQNKKRKYQVMFNAFILGSQRGPTRCRNSFFCTVFSLDKVNSRVFKFYRCGMCLTASYVSLLPAFDLHGVFHVCSEVGSTTAIILSFMLKSASLWQKSWETQWEHMGR